MYNWILIGQQVFKKKKKNKIKQEQKTCCLDQVKSSIICFYIWCHQATLVVVLPIPIPWIQIFGITGIGLLYITGALLAIILQKTLRKFDLRFYIYIGSLLFLEAIRYKRSRLLSEEQKSIFPKFTQSTFFFQIKLSTHHIVSISIQTIGLPLSKIHSSTHTHPKSWDFSIIKSVGICNDWMLIPYSLTYSWRNMNILNIFSIFCFSKSTSINTQYSGLCDTLGMMLFTKDHIKWKRIGKITWKVGYWCILKSSIILDTKKMHAILVQCPYRLDCGLSEFWKKKKEKKKKKKKEKEKKEKEKETEEEDLFDFLKLILGGFLCFKRSCVCI